MFCKNCGNEVGEAKFCSVCGAPMEEAPVAESVVEPVAEPVAEPVVEIAAEAVDPGKTLGMVGMILGIVSTALIVIFGWCGYFGLFASALAFDAAIAALVFSIIGKNRSKNVGKLNPQAKLGMIFSIVTMGIFMLAMFVIFALITVAMIFGVGGSIFSITDMMSSGYYY